VERESLVPGGRVERDEVVRVGRVHRLEDLLLGGAGGPRDLVDGWRAPGPLREVAHDLPQPEVQLLEPPRDPYSPSLVSEVALQLPDDRGGRVGREFDLPPRVEPVDRLHQADRGHLDEIVERLAASREAAGEVFDQPEVRLDELLTDGRVVRTPEPPELVLDVLLVRDLAGASRSHVDALDSSTSKVVVPSGSEAP
jgi:hypothetical protein